MEALSMESTNSYSYSTVEDRSEYALSSNTKMATGINYDDPEVRRGMELFGALFPPREPTPPRETGPSAEDIRKGAELFEALFYHRLYPPEISEETPPAAEPTPSPPRPPPVVLEPSPPKPTTPPRRIAVNTPPDWLVRSMDRDQFELPTHPDWYKRFKDPEYRTPPSPRQHVLFTSPPYFPDISSDDSALDEAFLPPSPPPPPEVYSPEPEPLPITEAVNYIEGVPFTSFDEALHKMRNEFIKYERDKEYIVSFLVLTPLVRECEILTEGLHFLVKMYLPEVDTENMNPYVAAVALTKYIRDVEERRGDIYVYHHPGLSQDVIAAMTRVHKLYAQEAIHDCRRRYFTAKHEVDKAEVEFERAKQQSTVEETEYLAMSDEIKRVKAEEERELKQYAANLYQMHVHDCPYQQRRNEEADRCKELRKQLVQLKEELERSKEGYERDVTNMGLWVNLFPPHFAENLREIIRFRLKPKGYEPLTTDHYMVLVETMEKDLYALRNSRKKDLYELKSECDRYNNILRERTELLEETRRISSELYEEQERLKSELNDVRHAEKEREKLWTKLREEKLYYDTYNEMLLGKIIALQTAETSQRELLSSSSESESPADISLGGAGSASPGTYGSGTFHVTQIESSPIFSESPDFLTDERPPSEMMNISGMSGSGGSPASQGGAEISLLDEERPPSEMMNISDLSGSGSPRESLEGSRSFFDSLEHSRSPVDLLEGSSSLSMKKTVAIPSPSKRGGLQMDVEIIPQEIRRSPSGQRVVCDLAVQMQEAASRPPRGIEQRNIVVRGTPPISQTVGRRVDRRYGMFTPRSAFRRRHVGVRRPLFADDFESPESPWGTGRRTHPELMNLTPRAPSPRPPRLDTTIEWETQPELNRTFTM